MEREVHPLLWVADWSDIALVGPPVGGVQRIDFGSGTTVRWPLGVPSSIEVLSELIHGPVWVVEWAWDLELNSRTADALGTANVNVIANPGTYWTEGLHIRVYPEQTITSTSESVELVFP